MMEDDVVVHASAFNLSGWAPYCIPGISFTLLLCYKVVQLLLFHSEAISCCEVQFNVRIYMSVCVCDF